MTDQGVASQILKTIFFGILLRFYLFVNIRRREIAKRLPASLVLLIETDLDIVCGAQRHDGMFWQRPVGGQQGRLFLTFLDFVAEQEDLVPSQNRTARLIHP